MFLGMTRKSLNRLLLALLVLLTLGGTYLGEVSEPGYLLMLAVTLSMAFKGRIIIDHFMELKNAHPLIRHLMQGYFYILPLVTILVYWLGARQL